MNKFIHMDDNDDGTTSVSMSFDGVEKFDFVLMIPLEAFMESLGPAAGIELTEEDMENVADHVLSNSVLIPDSL